MSSHPLVRPSLSKSKEIHSRNTLKFSESDSGEIELCKRRNSVFFNNKEKEGNFPAKKPDHENACSLDKVNILFINVIICLFFLVIFIMFWNSNTAESSLENLKKVFPSQKNETWYHIMSVLDTETPSVKSLILLHQDDKKTSSCLIKELVNLFSRSRDLNLDYITYKNVDEVEDYGQVLEHYRPIIERYRIFLTNLNIVPANFARIFHSLCDDVSSDIKPSLFIFTLRYYIDDESLKPIERVNTILEKAWKDLPKSDFFPLLSRVVRNVVDVVPEKHLNCN